MYSLAVRARDSSSFSKNVDSESGVSVTTSTSKEITSGVFFPVKEGCLEFFALLGDSNFSEILRIVFSLVNSLGI